jgi:hypothetical protein
MAAILDTRLTAKSYGKRILSSLPPMPIVRSLDNIVSLEDYLDQQELAVPPRLNNGVVEGIAGFVPHQIQ